MSFFAVVVGGSALLGAGASIYSASKQADAAQNAAQIQAQAADKASQLQYQEFQQQQANQQPWLDAGKAALPQLSSLASTAPQFTQADFLSNMDPAYQFDLKQGQDAIQRSAAARGGLQSGGTLKALNDYSQGMASNEYQNAYNRYMNNQNTQFNRLASVTGNGQTANAALGQAGMNMANNVGNNAMGAANAQGAAGIASANAWGNTLSSIGNGVGNNWMQYQMMSRMYPSAGSVGAGAGMSSLPQNYVDTNYTMPTMGIE